MIDDNNLIIYSHLFYIQYIALCRKEVNKLICREIKMKECLLRCSWVFSGIFPVEIVSWMFVLQNSNPKAIFCLFYKIIKGFWVFMTKSVSRQSNKNEKDIRVSVYIERKWGWFKVCTTCMLQYFKRFNKKWK